MTIPETNVPLRESYPDDFQILVYYLYFLGHSIIMKINETKPVEYTDTNCFFLGYWVFKIYLLPFSNVDQKCIAPSTELPIIEVD